MEKKFIGQFPTIMETQVLSSEMMSEIEGGCGKSCKTGCSGSCQPGNKNSNNSNVSL